MAAVLVHLYDQRYQTWQMCSEPKACKSLSSAQKSGIMALVVDALELGDFLRRGKEAGKNDIKSIERTFQVVVPGYNAQHLLSARSNNIEARAKSKQASFDQFLEPSQQKIQSATIEEQLAVVMKRLREQYEEAVKELWP
jgi:tRNA 2-selenouridine synthase SelU